MWWFTSRRGCPFGHKWVVASLSKERFEAAERCSWCGKTRVRGLLPADEQKQRLASAYERGSKERVRFVDQIGYEQAKGSSVNATRIAALKRQHQDKVQGFIDKIGAEKSKKKGANKHVVLELHSELRGLLFGKR